MRGCKYVRAIHSQDPDIECIPLVALLSLFLLLSLSRVNCVNLHIYDSIRFAAFKLHYFPFCFVCRCRSSCVVHLITSWWKWPFRVMRSCMCKWLLAFGNIYIWFMLAFMSYCCAVRCIVASEPSQIHTVVVSGRYLVYLCIRFWKTVCMYSMGESVCDCWVTETEEIEKIVFTWPSEANQTMLAISKKRQTSECECEWHRHIKFPRSDNVFPSLVSLTLSAPFILAIRLFDRCFHFVFYIFAGSFFFFSFFSYAVYSAVSTFP